MSPSNALSAARTALVLDHPFFGALALRLKMRADPGCGTAWVDGVTLGYDPAFVAKLPREQLIGLIAHEVMHCALGHPWRRGPRDHGRWNSACDYAINSGLIRARFTLPPGGLVNSDFDGKSSEWIYDRLPQDEGGGGGGKPDPNALGEVRDAPAQAEDAATTESAWQIAVQQAAQAAQARGELSGDLKRLVSEAVAPRVDWRAVLRRFVQQRAAADYTHTPPNRRYLVQGLYLPSMRSEQLGPVVVAIDTSGSIDATLLEQFAAEVRAIADESQPERIVALYCDSDIKAIEEFERGDPIALQMAGGGDTDFRPVFEHVAGMDEPPTCVIYLTDLCGTFPSHAPDVPTLWVSTGGTSAPFGEVVVIR